MKNQMLAQLLRRMDSDKGLVDLLADVQARSGNWTSLSEEWDRITKVSATEIQRAAQQYLVEANRTLLRMGVAKAGQR